MAGIALTGLASGLDTEAIVAQLLSAESGGKTRLNRQQVVAEQRISLLQGIQTKLSTLKTATAALKSVGSWAPVQTAVPGDATKLGARLLGGAAPGTYSVDTIRLASSAQRSFSYTPPGSAEALTIGSFSMTVDAGMALDDVVREINASDNGLVAVNAQGKLVVSSSTTGAASGFTWAGSSLVQDSERAGADAEYRIDDGTGFGAVKYSATNVVEHGLPGVELTLKTIGTDSVTIGMPTADTDALVAKLKSFVEAYNAVVDASRTATTEKPVTGANSTFDLQKGALFGDQALVRMSSQLRLAVGSTIGDPALLPQLAALGISTGATSGGAINNEAVNGRLVLDEAKAKSLITSNPTAVRELLGGKTGVDGLAQKLDAVLGPLTEAGAGIGGRIDNTNEEVSRIKKSLVLFDERLGRRETALRAQFSALEIALSRAQAQQSEMSSQLSALLSSSR